jgi:hypothetical protein
MPPPVRLENVLLQCRVHRTAGRNDSDDLAIPEDRQVSKALSGSTNSGAGVITAPTRVVCASRPRATTRKAMSRSVNMPTRRSSSTTITAPMFLRAMSLAASRTGVSGGALRMLRRITLLTG